MRREQNTGDRVRKSCIMEGVWNIDARGWEQL